MTTKYTPFIKDVRLMLHHYNQPAACCPQPVRAVACQPLPAPASPSQTTQFARERWGYESEQRGAERKLVLASSRSAVLVVCRFGQLAWCPTSWSWWW